MTQSLSEYLKQLQKSNKQILDLQSEVNLESKT